jgi:hypothetical protein
MRKISSKKAEEKKQKRRGAVLAIILVIVLFGSVFGIVVNSFGSSAGGEEGLNYNGHKFIYSDGYWILEDSENLFFRYNPKETDSLELEREELTKSIESYYNLPVYIYSEDSPSEIEIYQNIFPYSERMQNACPEGKECSEEFPLKDCSNLFIIVELSDKNEIYEEDNCVYIKGKKENLIKMSDEFLFRLFGIK